MDCHYGYQQCPGRDRLRPFGAVFCHGRVPVGGVLPGDPAAGICPAAFHPLCRSQGRCGLFSEIMLAIFHICGGVVSSVMSGMGRAVSTAATLPTEIVSAIEDVGFLASIPLWLVSMLGSLIVTVLSFILILTVYGRFFGFTCTQPWPRSHWPPLPERERRQAEKAFLKSYIGVCMEGGGRCSGLPDLLRVSLQQQSGSRRLPASRYHGVGIHRRNGVQHAGTHRAGQRRQPYYAGNVWAIESGIASQFGAHSGAEKDGLRPPFLYALYPHSSLLS